MAVTLADVASRAGVSLATASRVVSGSEKRVGAERAAAVRRAASELGYAVNRHARAIARGRTSGLAILLADITDPYFSAVAGGVMGVAEPAGLLVSLASTAGDPVRELGHLATMRAERVQGLVIVGSRSDGKRETDDLRRELRRFEDDGGRAATVGQDRLGIDAVTIDNRGGAAELARALIRQGHKQFAVLAGPPHLLTAQDRVAGFAEGLAEHGIEIATQRIVYSEFTREGGYHATARVLERRTRRICVFAANDVMAVGALARIRDAGLSVPGDIALAGFGGIPTLRDITPMLSTVALPLREAGAKAAGAVLAERRRHGHRVLPLAGAVVLCDSTGTA